MATTSIFEAPKRTRLNRNQAAPSSSVATFASSIDGQLLAILAAPLAVGETARDGFYRKEIELVTVCGQLAVLECRALHMRLANPRETDVLAMQFARLTADRRERVIHFLADARRRAALAGR